MTCVSFNLLIQILSIVLVIKLTKSDDPIPLVILYEANEGYHHSLLPILAAKSFQFHHPLSKVILLGKTLVKGCKHCVTVSLDELKLHDPREQSFLLHYIHSSSTSVQYQQVCFRRYFWLFQLMKEHSIAKVLFADVDIMYTTNINEVVDIEKSQNMAFSPVGTWFTIWSIETLNVFCDFIVDFYQRPANLVYADMIKFNTVPGKMQPPLHWPKGIPPREWSDMFVLQCFLASDPVVLNSFSFLNQNVKYSFPFVNQNVSSIKNADFLGNAHDVLKEASHSGLMQILSWEQKHLNDNRVRNMNCSYAIPKYHEQMIPGIHFQGNLKSQALGIFKHMFKDLDDECRKTLGLLL